MSKFKSFLQENLEALVKNTHPTEAELMAAAKKDVYRTVKFANEEDRPLPDQIADYILDKHKTLIASYPNAFSRSFTVEFFKKERDSNLMIEWLKTSVNPASDFKINQKYFNEVFYGVLESTGDSYRRDRSILYLVRSLAGEPMSDQDNALQARYKKWVMDFPVDVKKKIIEANEELLDIFEDDLPEQYKLQLVQKKPDLMKHFKKQTNRMKEYARWAKARVDRENRGFP